MAILQGFAKHRGRGGGREVGLNQGEVKLMYMQPQNPQVYIGEREGVRSLAPSSNTSSSSVVLGEALPENHELHHHHAIVLSEFSLNFSSPLDGSRRRRRPRAIHVLNAEAPLFGA